MLQEVSSVCGALLLSHVSSDLILRSKLCLVMDSDRDLYCIVLYFIILLGHSQQTLRSSYRVPKMNENLNGVTHVQTHTSLRQTVFQLSWKHTGIPLKTQLEKRGKDESDPAAIPS